MSIERKTPYNRLLSTGSINKAMDATWVELSQTEMATKSLARTKEGHPLYRLDENNVMRYVLADQTLDMRSTVNTELPRVYDIRADGGSLENLVQPTPTVVVEIARRKMTEKRQQEAAIIGQFATIAA